MLLISDANILIDMIEGELIEEMFKLPEDYAVPDILYEEELIEQHSDLVEKGLQIMEMNEVTVIEVFKLRQKYRRPGQNDLNTLALAKMEQLPLLTGDGDLRNAAKAENVDLEGTLWLVKRMVEEQLITKQKATEAYEKMREGNRRLPWHLVEKQLNEFN